MTELRPDDPYSNDPRFRDAVLRILRSHVPLLTSLDNLPASPHEGLRADYLYAPGGSIPSAIWHLTYRNGFWSVDAPATEVSVGAGEGTTSDAYTDLATVGPRIPIPRAGDYEVRFAADVAHATTDGIGRFAPGGTAVTPSDAVSAYYQAYVGTASTTVGKLKNMTLAAGNLDLVYKSPLGGTATFSLRTLSARPIRLT